MPPKVENPAADTSALEREIDQQVYALYGRTPEEIRIVCTDTGKVPEQKTLPMAQLPEEFGKTPPCCVCRSFNF